MNFKIFNKYLNKNNKIMKIMKIKDITHERIIFLQDIKLKIGLYIFNKNLQEFINPNKNILVRLNRKLIKFKTTFFRTFNNMVNLQEKQLLKKIKSN